MTTIVKSALTMAALLIGAAPAAGQQLIFDGDNFRSSDDPLRDDRLIGAGDRVQPGFEAVPIPLGPFAVMPQADVTLEYDSNILALENNVEDDLSVSVRPSIVMVAQGASFDLEIQGFAEGVRYLDRSLENYEQYGGTVEGRLEIQRGLTAEVDLGAGRYVESRTDSYAPANSLKRIEYTRLFAHGALEKTSGRLVGWLRYDVDRLDYDNGISRTAPIVPLFEENRSRTLYRPAIQAEYSFTPDTAIFGGVSYNWKIYDQNPPLPFVVPLPAGVVGSRDSEGFVVSGGIRFKPTPLMELSVAVGYLEQYYFQPLQDVSGFSAEAKFRWLPTRLTTVEARFARELEEGGSLFPGNTFVNRAEGKIVHELLRNLLLTATAGYEDIDFENFDREDSRFEASARAEYKANRNLHFSLEYRYLTQDSNGAARLRDFDQSQLLFSVTLRP